MDKWLRVKSLGANKFAMELFAFGMDPILGYLEARLQGILIDSIPAAGPIIFPAPQLPPKRQPPPALPGLPALPPQPPAKLCPRGQRP